MYFIFVLNENFDYNKINTLDYDLDLTHYINH